ncbi:conserved hypothetical protein [Pediculus humanus corporis]|uniref:WASH complex subunit CCDC53 n=1 Tax=Pediculus humanus subsp. corporis TaxID=121224 RepID=E0W0B3_PEDHC|nr:uncharacterized protein Phum_PHUM549390 [Pediculus humanus corporis]EEB19069.1 conserved hypothetical protein [Pediculus humanus corporis]
MNVEELSMIGPNVDLETVDPINKKRLLAFVNHYIVNTALFLNNLSKSYEQGLMTLENKIQKLESSIIMLEKRVIDKSQDDNNNDKEKNIDESVGEIKQEEESLLDPTLMKYVKMLQFGVPPPAVKLKMEQENVLPSLHDLVLNYNK